MELVAYVNGDVTTLTQILSQIAMALGGGTFMVAAKACAIIGIIIALFGGMLRGGQISPSTFMWPILISVLMLLPRVDLVIEDTKGGVSRVDDLPIGFAGPVSIITHLGLGASNLMTDYLGLDDYAITMDNGHLVSLRAPIVFSQVITQEEFQGPASTFHNGYLQPRTYPPMSALACNGGQRFPVQTCVCLCCATFLSRNCALKTVRGPSQPVTGGPSSAALCLMS